MDRKTIGRYEILGELGRGAMGSVLRAHDPAMGRDVAVKCILSAALAGDQMKEFRERFYREARAAGALSHPGIVPVFDVGEDDGVPYLVMELVQGRTLDAVLKQGQRYSSTGLRDRPADRRGARLRASQRHHSSRYQAGQHPHDLARGL